MCLIFLDLRNGLIDLCTTIKHEQSSDKKWLYQIWLYCLMLGFGKMEILLWQIVFISALWHWTNVMTNSLFSWCDQHAYTFDMCNESFCLISQDIQYSFTILFLIWFSPIHWSQGNPINRYLFWNYQVKMLMPWSTDHRRLFMITFIV